MIGSAAADACRWVAFLRGKGNRMIKKRAALIVLACVLVGLGDVDAAVLGQEPTASSIRIELSNS